MFKEYEVDTIKSSSHRHLQHSTIVGMDSRFFDGTVQDGRCGVGEVLRINDEHFFKLKFNCGQKQNILALWHLVRFATILGIDFLNIFWNSMVIVNWANQLWTLWIISLDQLC